MFDSTATFWSRKKDPNFWTCSKEIEVNIPRCLAFHFLSSHTYICFHHCWLWWIEKEIWMEFSKLDKINKGWWLWCRRGTYYESLELVLGYKLHTKSFFKFYQIGSHRTFSSEKATKFHSWSLYGCGWKQGNNPQIYAERSDEKVQLRCIFHSFL